MATEQKQPLSSSIHAAANNLINQMNTINERAETDMEKVEQDFNENEQQYDERCDEDEKQPSNVSADLEDSNPIEEEDIESTREDIEKFTLGDESAEGLVEPHQSYESFEDGREEEEELENVAALLVDNAIKGAAEAVISEDKELSEDEDDIFHINHQLVFNLLFKIKNITASYAENGDSREEAKNVLGSLWLVLLNYIEVCLNAHGLPVSAGRFFDTMDALHEFFLNTQDKQAIEQEVLWSLQKEYYKHLPYYLMYADQFNRTASL